MGASTRKDEGLALHFALQGKCANTLILRKEKKMYRIEVRAAEGGEDAKMFATELSTGIQH